MILAPDLTLLEREYGRRLRKDRDDMKIRRSKSEKATFRYRIRDNYVVKVKLCQVLRVAWVLNDCKYFEHLKHFCTFKKKIYIKAFFVKNKNLVKLFSKLGIVGLLL